ncbi:MAG: holo-ACP synthase [Phycisphaerae bacterium]
MNVVSHGIDLVACSRIERVWQAHGDAFLERIFTPAERIYCLACGTPAVRLAGRFAVKEAVFKALGTGWRGGMRWTDVETLPDGLGRPQTRVSGETAQTAQSRAIAEFLVSISHAGDWAMASAIGVAKAL